MGLYLRPKTSAELTACLKQDGLVMLAGGTDLYPQYVGKSFAGDILDLTGVDELAGITETDDAWRIGATTRWADIIAAPLPPCFDGLKQAASEIGGRQIQNSATIGGNICNASPAADSIPALLTLDAEVEIFDGVGRCVLPLDQFITGNRQTTLPEQAVVASVIIKKSVLTNGCSGFLKLGSRKSLVISIAMVSGLFSVDDQGNVASAALAVGACSAVAERLPELEQALMGAPAQLGLGRLVTAGHFAALAPLDDIRGSADYRRRSALVLMQRLLDDLGGRA